MNDCVFNGAGGCKILTREHCRGCSFKKTQEQFDEGRKKAKKRIDNMPMLERHSISEKYYNKGLKKGDL